MSKNGRVLAGFSAVDDLLHLLGWERRVDDPNLPFEPDPLFGAMLLLGGGVSLNYLLEALLEQTDLLLTDVDIVQRQIVRRLTGRNQDSQVGIPLLELVESSLNRREEAPGSGRLAVEILSDLNCHGTVGGRDRQQAVSERTDDLDQTVGSPHLLLQVCDLQQTAVSSSGPHMTTAYPARTCSKKDGMSS